MSVPASMNAIREFDISASSTETFGRVLCSARTHHFVVDGPVQNGCPGEAITPPELFLNAVASCGVELMQVLAKNENIPVGRIELKIHCMLDREKQPRAGVTTFNLITVDATLWGVTEDQAKHLVAGFQGRCPIYGTMAVATQEVRTTINVGR